MDPFGVDGDGWREEDPATAEQIARDFDDQIIKEVFKTGCDGECLVKNKQDGPFQKHVATALRQGRAKKTATFTNGPSDCGKSSVLYPFQRVYKVYEPPDPAGAWGYPLSTLIGRELCSMNEWV